MKQKLFLGVVCAVVAFVGVHALAQASQTPAQPQPEATTAAMPIPVAQADAQAISNAINEANAFMRSIAVLQKELDSATATAQRAFTAAQARHPDMPIDMKTWQYVPKK